MASSTSPPLTSLSTGSSPRCPRALPVPLCLSSLPTPGTLGTAEIKSYQTRCLCLSPTELQGSLVRDDRVAAVAGVIVCEGRKMSGDTRTTLFGTHHVHCVTDAADGSSIFVLSWTHHSAAAPWLFLVTFPRRQGVTGPCWSRLDLIMFFSRRPSNVVLPSITSPTQ